MAFDAHANLVKSTVATAPSPALSGTSLVIAAGDGAKLPAPPFNMTVWPVNTEPTQANAEILRVTNVATDTLTITRATGTEPVVIGPRAIVVGDQIALTVTVKSVKDLETALNLTATDFVLGNGAGGPTVQGTKAANLFVAGPISGAAAIMAARAIDPLDLNSTVAYVTSQFDKTDATLANITGLTFTLVSGKTYAFRAVIHTTLDGTGGYKLGLGGAVTATSIIAQVVAANDTGNAFGGAARATALGLAASGNGVVSEFFVIEGTIVVNAGGTFTVQFAQNAANGTSSVLVGSSFTVW